MTTTCQAQPIAYPDLAVPVIARGTLPPAWPSPLHRHSDPDWEICIVAAGDMRQHVAGRTYELTAGDVLVIGPGDPHMLEAISGQRWVLIFRETLFLELPGNVRGDLESGLQVEGVPLPRHFHVPDVLRTVLWRILQDLSDECACQHHTKRAMCAALLAEFLLVLARAASSTQGVERVNLPSAARQVILDVCAEVDDAPGRAWTLDELSRRSGYGASQLTALFRAVKGVTPWRWLSEQRIRYSRELLSNCDRSVEEIALEVGFGSRSQFHRAFRDFTGMTPGRYRSVSQQP